MESAEVMHGTNTHRVLKDGGSFVEVICLWSVKQCCGFARYLAFGLMKTTNKPLNCDIWYNDRTLHYDAFT
jgi:hypothetical protein